MENWYLVICARVIDYEKIQMSITMSWGCISATASQGWKEV